ncbi:MAG: S9 family peptidase [Enterobacterales bacterium]|nr:S9 family peptidase [Enterobacterales bacterium]
MVNFHWGNDERLLLEVQKRVGYLDKKGGPRELYAADIDGRHRKQIFKAGRSSYRIASLLENDPKHILLLKSHGGDYHAGSETLPTIAVKINIYTGNLNRLTGQPTQDVNQIIFDENDEMRLAANYVTDKEKFGWGEYFIYLKNRKSGHWLRSDIVTKTDTRFNFVGLSADGDTAYVTSDEDGKTNVLYSLDLKTKKKTKIFQSDIVDIGGMLSSEDGIILGYTYQPNYNVVEFLDKKHRESIALAGLFAAFPGQDVSFTSYTKNAEQAIIFVRSDTNPGVFYLFDFASNSLKRLAKVKPWLKTEYLAEMQPIQYTARDGLVINGYLTIPKGKKAKNLPLIINPHGGPHGPRDRWGFNPDVQFLANRGYAVLQMNFRGSGGYGREFETTGYRKWGREMQDDITDATQWAIKAGIADPNRVCIYGGSYGGYATLMGVVKEPDLYKCGLGYVGVYDLETMYTDGDTHQSKGGIRFLEHILGTDKNELRANSPARHVDRIKASLFIAHGKEDVRVPMAQFYALTKALDRAKIPYQSMVKDEGHGYQKLKNRIAFYKAMEKFFEKNLK